jgi:hypothetical protein
MMYIIRTLTLICWLNFISPVFYFVFCMYVYICVYVRNVYMCLCLYVCMCMYQRKYIIFYELLLDFPVIISVFSQHTNEQKLNIL